MTENLKNLNIILTSDVNLSSDKDNKKTDFTNLINELTKILDDGNILFKENKFEEARNKYEEGYKKFEDESSKIYSEFYINEQCFNLLMLFKKLLSNLALCYYGQEKFKEAIVYDLKLIALDPKFEESIVRLFNSYSKINKNQQAVYYGELFMDLDKDIRDKFQGTEKKIEDEKIKLNKLQKEEEKRIKRNMIQFCVPIFIFFLSLVFWYIFNRKRN